MTEICEFIANISTHLQDILCQYLLEEEKEEENLDTQSATETTTTTITLSKAIFKSLLAIFHHMVQIRVLLRTTSTTNLSPNSDTMVIDATKCLAMTCNI